VLLNNKSNVRELTELIISQKMKLDFHQVRGYLSEQLEKMFSVKNRRCLARFQR